MPDETLVFDSASALEGTPVKAVHLVAVVLAVALACFVGYSMGAANARQK